MRWPCYNVGEPTLHLMDDIGFLFKNEQVWSGNRFDKESFQGGRAYLNSPGPIGGRLEMPVELSRALAE